MNGLSLIFRQRKNPDVVLYGVGFSTRAPHFLRRIVDYASLPIRDIALLLHVVSITDLGLRLLDETEVGPLIQTEHKPPAVSVPDLPPCGGALLLTFPVSLWRQAIPIALALLEPILGTLGDDVAFGRIGAVAKVGSLCCFGRGSLALLHELTRLLQSAFPGHPMKRGVRDSQSSLDLIVLGVLEVCYQPLLLLRSQIYFVGLSHWSEALKNDTCVKFAEIHYRLC